ncbi:MAG: preprotein translocase subunit SecE [Gemmataceae bacterium]|nr:preprotein translocase subunit SecE [Gemmataceae bacterium]
MTMAVAEQTALEQTPQSPQRLQLGLSSLLGAALVLFCFAFVLGGLPAVWEHLFHVAEDVAAGRPPVINEFLSATLLLLTMIAVGVGLTFLIHRLERSSAQPGLRAGVFWGALALVLVLSLATKLGWTMTAQGEDLNVIGVGITVVIGAAMIAAVVWLFTRPGFGRWLIRFEEQGWFHAESYKGNQGVRVRRGTIVALLTIGVCGIYTLVSNRSLGSDRFGANDWVWYIPFWIGEYGERLFLPLIHQVHLTVPILLAVLTLWVAWRVVNWPVFADFLIATEAEMNKVSWTTRKRLVQDTIVVLVTVFLMTAFLFVVDILWIKILTHPWIAVLQVDVKTEFQKQQEKTQW